MNLSFLLFSRTPPSPRTPSVTRIPRTDGGHTMPVGWNWVNSMSISSAPASYAMAYPSPVYSQEFDVIRHARPPPPVARTRSEEHTSELQSLAYLVCRLLLEKKKTYVADRTQ